MARQPTATASPSTEVVGYLRQRTWPGPLVIPLLLAMAYPFAASAPQAAVFLLLCALAGCCAARAPRWVCYSVLIAALLVLLSKFVFTISNGPQDSQSDRDETVEMAAQALLAGTNGWAKPTQLGTVITTGPASVLAVLPSVLATGRINALSFVFYAVFLSMLLGADLRYRNHTFLSLGLLFASGFLGIRHAL